MYKFIVCLLFILCMSCNKDNNQIQKTEKLIAISNSEATDIDTPKKPPYEIKLNIEKLNTNTSQLVVNMLLEKGSYYVSPYSKRDFKGKFNIYIAANDKLKVDNILIETPQSTEVYDSHPFVNGPVNWVSVNTTYKQQLHSLSEEDFNVSGLIQFTIEPRCTLEKIPFMISQQKGEMKIKIGGC